MNNYYDNNLDFDKLKDSIETLSSLENCLKMTDLSSYIIDIESIIKTINFEHNNFITNYKNDVHNIIDDIEQVKKEVNKLNDALTRTINNYEKSSYNDNDIKELSTLYNYTDFSKIKSNFVNLRENILTDTKHLATSGNITKIPKVSMDNNESSELVQPYNTVPIGLGIAAAGISASIGAVIVNEKEQTKPANFDIEPFEEKIEEEDTIPEKNNNIPDAVYESYHASRNQVNKDIFYNESESEYFKDE